MTRGRSAYLVDVNNVRGAMSFPSLADVCAAARRWALAKSALWQSEHLGLAKR